MKDKNKKWILSKQPFVIIGAFFLLASISFGLYYFFTFQISRQQENEFIMNFTSEAQEITHKSEELLGEYANMLFASRGLFNASDIVERRDWKDFVDTQELQSRFPAIRTVGIVNRVSPEEREEFVDSVRSELEQPNFDINPSGDRDEYYIVNYLEPLKGNESAFGFDLFSNESRKTAIELARDTNAVAITEPITLVQDQKGAKDFLMILPIYKKDASSDTLSERRDNIEGVVSAAIDVNQLFSEVVMNTIINDTTSFQVKDITSREQLLFDSSQSQVLAPLSYDVEKIISQPIRIIFGGRIWEVEFSSRVPLKASPIDILFPLITLLLGLGVSFLVGLALYDAFRLQIRAEKMANRLTSELQKFKFAADSAFDVIVITDIDGIVLYANNALEKITGFSPEKALGTKAGVLWGKLMPTAYYKKLWNTIKTKKETFVGVVTNKRKNGEKFYASITISPIMDDNGDVQFFVAIERDITKEKQVDKVKTEFVSLAAHQLRTPLTSIRWYTEMMLNNDMGRMTKKQIETMKEVEGINKRMIKLVNALLNVSRLDLGTFVIEPKLIDVTKLANQYYKELLPLAAQKKIKMTKKYEKGLPKLKADPNLLGVIFHNLLSNATKFTPEQGKVILRIGKEGKNLRIEVQDNGMGIPKEQQSQIFSKLFRGDNAKIERIEGTGLGLYTVKSILDEAGGKVWFESVEGQGTTFFVEIPLTGMKSRKGTKQIIL